MKHRDAHSSRLKRLISLFSLGLLLLGALFSTPVAFAAPNSSYTSARTLSGGCDYSTVHIANSSNISGNVTYLDLPGVNNNPSAQLFVTQNWNPNGRGSGVYNNHPIGVWYDAWMSKWSIFNQDHAPMPDQAAFNINYGIAGCTAVTTFTSIATTSSISGNTTWIDNPLINWTPYLVLMVTANWNPNNRSLGVYDAHPVGVIYNYLLGKWGIVNMDGGAMPDAAAFNVAVVTTYGLVHTSTSSNTHDDWTDIWGGWTWTSPDDTFQVTPRAEGVSTAHNIGVWYDTSAGTWAAFNEDRATMLTGLDFDVKPY